jgi:IMP dehydrogenase/GMP reductase
MIQNIKGYSYNDLTIVPAEISKVSSRSECNPFNSENWLPIFTAPMASVINFENYEIFLDNGITPIIPRNINLEVRKDLMNDQQWVALSLKEFEDLFINNYLDRINDFRTHYFICLDIANGHMQSLYEKCHTAKKNAIVGKYKLTIMTGNIANPETYKWICEFNRLCSNSVIDYIRVGIGGGSGCITTSNVSIHYPQASLIDECYQIKQLLLSLHNDLGESKYKESLFPKIVADGGIRNYDHVIKALALGADYVMIGSVFAQCIESAGDKISKNIGQKVSLNFPYNHYCNFRIDAKGNVYGYYNEEYIQHLIKPWKDKIDKTEKDFDDYKVDLRKYEEKLKSLHKEKNIGPIDVKFFGMASADGQKSISGKKTKTAEGITKYLPVKYTLSSWVENMVSYLRSAMSYCDCFKLEEFIGKPTLIVNSISEIHAVNK